MSGFDGMARSQAQASQATQHYDDQRFESMRQTGQSVMQLGQFAVEVQQLATEQAMRVQEHEINMQQSMAKLQSMNMMNESDMLRQQVRGMKLQNDAMEFENQHRAEMYDSSKKMDAATKYRSIAGTIGVDRLIDMGLDPDPAKWNSATMEFPKLDPAKQEEALKNRERGRYGYGLNENVEAKRFQNEWLAASKALQQALSSDTPPPPEVLDTLYEAEEVTRKNWMESRGITGGGSSRSRNQPKAEKPSPEVQKIANILSPSATIEGGQYKPQSVMLGPGGERPDVLPPQSAQRVASFVWQNRERIHKELTSKAKSGRAWPGSDPASTAELVAKILKSKEASPSKIGIIRMLIAAGMLDQQEAEALAK